MAKKRKVSKCDKFWRASTRFDMFGERINFNMDGKETYDTCCGSLVTLIVFLAVAVYCLFQIRLYQKENIRVPVVA